MTRYCETKYQRQFCLTEWMTHIAHSDLKCRTLLFPKKGLARIPAFQLGHLEWRVVTRTEKFKKYPRMESLKSEIQWGGGGWEGEGKDRSSSFWACCFWGRGQQKNVQHDPSSVSRNQFLRSQVTSFSVLSLTWQKGAWWCWLKIRMYLYRPLVHSLCCYEWEPGAATLQQP